MARRRLSFCLAVLAVGVSMAEPANSQEQSADSSARFVTMRMAGDSAVVGHYKFTVKERQRLAFDIAADDPRAELLASATEPKATGTEIAATIVSTPRSSDEDRRYLAYWLGYRVTGDALETLSAFQWDTLFQQTGRRAVLTFSARGHPRGVQVSSDAHRPVGQALADALSAMALALPEDSVTEGSQWEDHVAMTLKAPDGSGFVAAVQVTYRLREIQTGPDGTYARIEFDGEPVSGGGDADVQVSGRYFGESVFAVDRGRYERLMAIANFEIEWEDTSGLPPSRSFIDWEAQFAGR